jgi:predicted dehydrogenase
MLRGNKNVLVEKPTTVTYEDTVMMYREAAERGLFLMTNHWTRFFPLIKYLRRAFLTSNNDGNNDVSDGRLLKQQTTNMHHNLGKVMAMKGDFSFATPLSPSDRFLNHSLGGGVTLDIGCYLIELALLAAYDHSNITSNIHPDGIEATGHGIMYNGVEFPVDVESSFSLRWGGGKYGVWNGECTNNDDTECDIISIGGKGTKTLKHNEQQQQQENKFSMIASFQASFRRPSTFEVEYVFEHGRIAIAGPGNCPNEMTIYEYERYGPLKRETKVSFPLPSIKNELVKRYGTPYYPRAEGFAYVIDAIEKCMVEKGVPGRRDDERWLTDGGCLEMEENTIEEQLVTVELTANVLKKMGYFD